MNHNNNEIHRILASLSSPLTSELVSGRLCGLVCEVCPLRPWKSLGVMPTSCNQILEASRPLLRKQKNGWVNRFKASLVSMLSSDFTKGTEKNTQLAEYLNIGK